MRDAIPPHPPCDYLTDDENPDPRQSPSPLHQQVGDDPAHHGPEGPAHQRDPGHEAVDGVSRVELLKENLSVVGPHVAPGVPDAPGDTKDKHPRHDEGDNQQNKPLTERQLLLRGGNTRRFLGDGSLWFPDGEEDDGSDGKSGDAAEEEDPAPAEDLVYPVADGKGQGVPNVDAKVVDAES